MAGDKVVFEYKAALNPDEAYIAGVPLRDLTQEDLDRLTQYQIDGVIACAFYAKIGRMQHKKDESDTDSVIADKLATVVNQSADSVSDIAHKMTLHNQSIKNKDVSN